MNNFFKNNDTISAVEAQYNAQKIAFAPIVFQVARSMRDLGVLKVLYDHKEGSSVEFLAEKTSLSVYGIKVLIETSLSADIVSQKEELYFLTKTGYFLLFDSMTNANMNYNHYVNYKGLYSLDEAIKSGTPSGLKEFGEWETIYPALSILPQDVKQSWFTFDHFYSDSAFPQAAKILLALEPANILDVGGNTGKFSMLMAKSNSSLHVSIMDLPEQIVIAKENIEKAGISGQVEFICSNVLEPTHTFPKGFDIIWMSQFLDCFSEDEIVGILIKVKEAMSEKTTLCIMEPFWDRQRFETSAFCIINTSPYFTAMANGCSKMYHSMDFIKIVEKAGLRVVEIFDNLGVCQSIFKITR
ncbi:MAG: class I SAM-dependent methyltransferase [Sulfurospirillaceae bacterium]|nr:class I SAM-dependent methyltransferase [Sulfurospirillaceae bacterium]